MRRRSAWECDDLHAGTIWRRAPGSASVASARPMIAAAKRSAPAGDTGADPPTSPLIARLRRSPPCRPAGRSSGSRTTTVVPAPSVERMRMVAAMQFDQRLGDGEAQARAVMGLGELAFDLLERPAELLQRVARNADAGILDADHHRAARHAAAHRDAALLGREFDGVGQQVERDLLERAAVGLETHVRMRPWT